VTFEWLGCAVCAPIQKEGQCSSYVEEDLFAYLLCARGVYQDNQLNLQHENVPTINETSCEEIVEILQRESEDRMEWENVLKDDQNVYLFVLNFQ
jgi:hypothetical protein